VYSIRFTGKSERQFLRLDARTRARLEERIDQLAQWPNTTLDVRPLRGNLAGVYRLRVGQYRVILVVDEERKRISVREIGPRGSIY